MKKLIIIMVLLGFVTPLLYSRENLKAVEIYVCHTSKHMAEVQARSMASNRILSVVQSCSCEGVHPDLKSEVPKIKTISNRGYTFSIVTCDDADTNVYSCLCIGHDGF